MPRNTGSAIIKAGTIRDPSTGWVSVLGTRGLMCLHVPHREIKAHPMDLPSQRRNRDDPGGPKQGNCVQDPTPQAGSAAPWPQLHSLLALELPLLPQLPPKQPRAGFWFSFLYGPLLPCKRTPPVVSAPSSPRKGQAGPSHLLCLFTENSC